MTVKKSSRKKNPGEKWWKFFLTIEFIIGLIVVCFALYTMYHTKKKFTQGFNINIPSIIIKPKKKKKSQSYNKHENRCREIFENIFNQKFKSVRPDWLKNPVTEKNLEIDGYCDHIETDIGIGLGYEYDGKQHSSYVPHFHKGGLDEFKYQMKKDEWKDLACKKRGVLLIRIPHFVDYNDLERYIKNKLKKNNLP